MYTTVVYDCVLKYWRGNGIEIYDIICMIIQLYKIKIWVYYKYRIQVYNAIIYNASI